MKKKIEVGEKSVIEFFDVGFFAVGKLELGLFFAIRTVHRGDITP